MNQDRQKKEAAEAALEFISSGDVIGVGTGSTTNDHRPARNQGTGLGVQLELSLQTLFPCGVHLGEAKVLQGLRDQG